MSRTYLSFPPPSSTNPSSPRVGPRVVDVVLGYLKAEGVRVVFGIPGGLLYPFFDAVELDDELRLVVTKHEEGSAFMADGYARVGRRLSVCAGTSGPGATNLLTGVSCAFADGVPLLVFTGQAASHAFGKGAAQETTREDIDIVAMFRPVTKYSAMVTSPGAMGHHLRRALRLALTGRPGPVHLNVPVDLWEKPLTEDWFHPRTYRPDVRTFDRAAVQSACDVLLEAAHPVLLVGSGVAGAGAEEHVRSLAEMFPARVATTPRAKGVFPEDHPLSLGILGVAGHREARRAILGDEVDVLFTVGASLSETSTFNWDARLRPSRALIQLDVDADRIGRNYPVDVPLVGDAQSILMELVYHVHRRLREGARAQSVWPRELLPLAESRYYDATLRNRASAPLSPPRWRVELEDALPPDAVIFSDIGGHMLFNLHHLCVRDRQRFIINLGFGSMGHGTIAPIGAALAEPSRPVIAIVGDGCFAMNGMDLLTAVEYDVPVIWIVENNNMHAITWHCSAMLAKGRGLEAARYRRPLSVAAIASAMGMAAWRVTEPGVIADRLREALRLNAPALIEVCVDASVCPPLGERARSLAGFIES